MMKAVILLSVLAVAFATECGENEHFERCGTACPLKCENYQNPLEACVKRCDIGCHCDKGYLRNAEGRCVRPKQCPKSASKQCGENQHYESCGTACPLTCKNYQNPPKFCVLMCNPGCHCNEGYVKTDDGECVRPEQCPAHAADADLCSSRANEGKCLGYFPRYFYNQETGKCDEFIYGGCGGNKNNFETEEECLNTCG